MKRIKYRKRSDGMYESIKYLKSQQGDLIVMYNIGWSFIIAQASGKVLVNGTKVSKYAMMEAIKKELIKLGVTFEKESRTNSIPTSTDS